MRRGVTGLSFASAGAGRSEGVQGPNVHAFVVTEDVEIAVVGLNAKIDGSRRIPTIFNIVDLKDMPAQDEAQGPLISAIACIALDANLRHKWPPSASLWSVVYRHRERVSRARVTLAGPPPPLDFYIVLIPLGLRRLHLHRFHSKELNWNDRTYG